MQYDRIKNNTTSKTNLILKFLFKYWGIQIAKEQTLNLNITLWMCRYDVMFGYDNITLWMCRYDVMFGYDNITLWMCRYDVMFGYDLAKFVYNNLWYFILFCFFNLFSALLKREKRILGMHQNRNNCIVRVLHISWGFDFRHFHFMSEYWLFFAWWFKY